MSKRELLKQLKDTLVHCQIAYQYAIGEGGGDIPIEELVDSLESDIRMTKVAIFDEEDQS